jgi:hypothetical protein
MIENNTSIKRMRHYLCHYILSSKNEKIFLNIRHRNVLSEYKKRFKLEFSHIFLVLIGNYEKEVYQKCESFKEKIFILFSII